MTVTQITLKSGQGRNNAEPLSELGSQNNSLTFGITALTLHDLSTASLTGISPGDWETNLAGAYSKCRARSTSLQSFTFVDPVFDSDD